ncbi:MAG: NADH-quinone oxidoreductase subunit K [Acidobacteriota bacterium]|nr:NADH-quinone oxidoreductase subunit K [Acidobacteriota bacterium]
MEAFWAVITGLLFSAGIFLMLRRHLAKLILGLILLSNAANLVIFSSGGLVKGHPSIIPPGEATLPTPHGDSLPQVLILTAIVISFGVLGYFLTLLRSAHKTAGTEDLEQLRGLK